MKELRIDELEMVNGGWWQVALAYAAALDLAWEFGEGLGHGLYESIHQIR